jgi:ATP-dependent Clp protease ATP-binding subunit ClpA
MMVRRLTVDARRVVLEAAVNEACRRGDRRVGTDHLLLAVLHDQDSEPARAIGVDLASARAAADSLDQAALAAVGVRTEGLTLPVLPAQTSRNLRLTSGARAAMKRAIDGAKPRKSGRIETRDFLLALLVSDRPDPGAELLEALGVDASEIRERLAG